MDTSVKERLAVIDSALRDAVEKRDNAPNTVAREFAEIRIDHLLDNRCAIEATP